MKLLFSTCFVWAMKLGSKFTHCRRFNFNGCISYVHSLLHQLVQQNSSWFVFIQFRRTKWINWNHQCRNIAVQFLDEQFPLLELQYNDKYYNYFTEIIHINNCLWITFSVESVSIFTLSNQEYNDSYNSNFSTRLLWDWNEIRNQHYTTSQQHNMVKNVLNFEKKFPISLPMLNLKHTNNIDQTEYIAQPKKSLEKFLHLTLKKIFAF